MKKKLFTLALAITAALSLAACNINDDDDWYYDNNPPAPPAGIEVFNGDDRVDITWNWNRESDVAGYNVYFSYSYSGEYTLIGSTSDNYFIDRDAVNGNTYYYAVTAYDFNGNESDLSDDVIYSTPRPEGYNQAIYDYISYPNSGGYSFTTYSPVPYDGDDADFFFENYQGTYYLGVWDDTDIRDMGPTRDIYDIPEAPETGWSPSKDEIAIPGHTYVIWTWDNHFAKVRVKSISRDRIVFDWAFQLVEGERQLKQKAVPAERAERNKEWLVSKRTGK
ncbi:MAG: hypothetical protein R6W90_14020 [Ignavibacteriaceae bacterium]